ncbi:response regulator transcription factor [Gordonia desulfuricans]|uniref:response regulator transcription factor n=1 Tax=Gordonia desulfuricans TaxID=89051 RepID=UPI000AE5509F
MRGSGDQDWPERTTVHPSTQRCPHSIRGHRSLVQEAAIITGTDRPAPSGRSAPTPTGRLRVVPAPASRRPRLSDREIEVMLTWLRAESKQEAAGELFISVSTVSTHISRIRVKYESAGRPATSKSSLFVRAIQDGYATLDDW